MEIIVEAPYQHDYIPPRGKNVRHEIRHVDVKISIQEVDKEMSQLAIVKKEFDRWELKYFWCNEKLWTKARCDSYYNGTRPVTKEWFSKNAGIYFYIYDPFWSLPNFLEAQGNLKRDAERLIIIGGIVYEESKEPVYKVDIEAGSRQVKIRDSYTGCTGMGIYSLLEKKEAIAHATAAAMDRGNIINLPIEPESEFTVLIPAAICFPGDSARIEAINGKVAELRKYIYQYEALITELLAQKSEFAKTA
jgi:hypothetical protein